MLDYETPTGSTFGLTQGKQSVWASEPLEVGPLFTNYLAEELLIDGPNFSLALHDYNDKDQSYVDFGEP